MFPFRSRRPHATEITGNVHFTGKAASAPFETADRRGLVALAVLIVLALLGLTGWNLTRSDAIERARRAYVQGKLPVCVAEALAHLRRQPWNQEAALLVARSLSRMDHALAAEPYYQRTGPLSLEDAQIRAYGLVRANQREEAVRAYEAILARWPNNITALRRLAAVEITRVNQPALRKLADRLIDLPDGAAIGYTLKGVVYHDDHDWEESARAFERVLKLDPTLQSMPLPRRLFWTQFTTALLKSGRTEDGRTYLSQALSTTPDAQLMNFLGKIYDLEGNTDEAERCYRQSMEWDPKNYAPFMFLGRLALYRQEFEKAAESLERAVQLAPRQVDALSTLALVYRKTGRADDADRLQARVAKLRARATQAPASRNLPRYAL